MYKLNRWIVAVLGCCLCLVLTTGCGDSGSENEICTPECQGRTCGPDGCGSVCGSCGLGETCVDAVCMSCIPQCDSKSCGDDGCGGVCGNCGTDQACENGVCKNTGTCTPTCGGKQCGDDGCGGQCPNLCNADQTCKNNVCVTGEPCTPQCDGTTCGDDGCGSLCTCGPGTECDAATKICGAPTVPCGDVTYEGCCDGQVVQFCYEDKLTSIDCVDGDTPNPNCGWNAEGGYYDCGTDGMADPSGANPMPCGGACVPACAGKTCGPDGCGGSCGDCPTGENCEVGQCVSGPCTPVCGDAVCGDDGCGATCGECAANETCKVGQCISDSCIPNCVNNECGDDGCGEPCGTCAAGEMCINNFCELTTSSDGNTCASPFVLTALPDTYSGDTSMATDELTGGGTACESSFSLGDIGDGSMDQVWEYTPTHDGEHTVTLTAMFDSVLYVLTDCTDSMSCTANDDIVGVNKDETVSFTGTVGVPIWIVVDGWGISSAKGPYTLSLKSPGPCASDCTGKTCGDDGCGGSCGPCPPGEACSAGQCAAADLGDNCANPIVIDGLPFTHSGDTTDASNEYSYDANACPGEDSGWGGGSNEHVFVYTATQDGTVTFTVDATFDSTIYAATDCDTINTTCLAALDQVPFLGAEVIALTLAASETVYFFVDGYSNFSATDGAYTLTVEGEMACVPSCETNNCGPDGCGDSCGACGPTQACVSGQCTDVSGTLPPGASCWQSDLECEPGTQCIINAAFTDLVCVMDVPAGGSCMFGSGGCAEGSTCQFTDNTYSDIQCFADNGAGQNCGQALGNCEDGYGCVPDDNQFKNYTCQVDVAVNLACYFGKGLCQDGASCYATSAPNLPYKCYPDNGVGQACGTGLGGCDEDSVCLELADANQGNMCHGFAAEGAPCGLGVSACVSGLGCMFMAEADPAGTCQPLLWAGQPCGLGKGACIGATKCIYTNVLSDATCVKKVLGDQPCGVGTNQTCWSGLECTFDALTGGGTCQDKCLVDNLYSNNTCDTDCMQPDPDCF